MSRVLIVEDEETLGMILCDILGAAGHDAELVANGADALRRLADAPPDVLLLDLMIPVVDGVDVLRRVEGAAGSPRVVVMTSASRHAIDGLRYDVFLPKPFGRDAMLAAIGGRPT